MPSGGRCRAARLLGTLAYSTCGRENRAAEIGHQSTCLIVPYIRTVIGAIETPGDKVSRRMCVHLLIFQFRQSTTTAITSDSVLFRWFHFLENTAFI